MAKYAKTAQGVLVAVTGMIGGSEKTLYLQDVKSVPEIGQSPDKIDVTTLTDEMKSYIKDIPDYSQDLDFVMLANPLNAPNSNLKLIQDLIPSATYKWTIIYPAHKAKYEIQGEWTYKMGAGSVSSALELTITVIPKGNAAFSEFTGTFTMTYDANGGTGTMTDPSSPYDAGSTIVVLANSFTPPSTKTFVNWNTKADGTGVAYSPGETIPAVQNNTLYAQWTV